LESSTTELNNNYLTENTNKEDTNKELVCKDIGKDIEITINFSTAANHGFVLDK
jgi:hypothetical protein